jgi:hypothetical protein
MKGGTDFTAYRMTVDRVPMALRLQRLIRFDLQLTIRWLSLSRDGLGIRGSNRICVKLV